MESSLEIARNLSAVILAGGQSSRFGRDKAHMEIAGKEVLQRLLEVLHHFPFQKVAVMTGKRRNRVPRESVEFLPDDHEGLGPIGGIATALRRLPGGLFVMACDMPLVSTSLVEWLLFHYESDLDAVIPRSRRGVEPLLGIYLKNFLPVIVGALDDGCYALHRVFDRGKVCLVDVPQVFEDRHELANINTPEEYRQVERWLLEGKWGGRR